jgi:hypothetical protein
MVVRAHAPRQYNSWLTNRDPPMVTRAHGGSARRVRRCQGVQGTSVARCQCVQGANVSKVPSGTASYLKGVAGLADAEVRGVRVEGEELDLNLPAPAGY